MCGQRNPVGSQFDDRDTAPSGGSTGRRRMAVSGNNDAIRANVIEVGLKFRLPIGGVQAARRLPWT